MTSATAVNLDEQFFTMWFARSPMMAIFRGYSPERTLELCEAAWSMGIELVEIPLQGDESREALRRAVELGKAHNRPVGAGTIVSRELVDSALQLGAAFTVAPGFSESVANATQAAGLPHLPGVATASEVQRASAAGYVWLKAFPASVLGAEWITAMKGPFPESRFVATGGVTPGNAVDFVSAGAGAVALGAAVERSSRAIVAELKAQAGSR